ncbi:MAG: type I toxin-antitoxin system SymE family toxin [Tannerella sp.]|nr:type I toxin-antitoxin system SymE family toxin [Tannerella sp.]
MKKTDDIQIRNITVYGHFSPRSYHGECLVPQIRLNGKWLREAGFDVQDRIKIVVSNKCLVIIPDEEKKDDL